MPEFFNLSNTDRIFINIHLQIKTLVSYSDPVVLAYVGTSYFQDSHLSLSSKFVTEHYALTILPFEKRPVSLFIEKDSLRTEAATGDVL